MMASDLSLESIVSMSSLSHAWDRVRENRGAAGGDGITIKRFEAMRDEHLLALADDVLSGDYRPGPVRQVIIRSPRKDRPIALLCLRDRVLQRAVLDAIGPHCERRFLPASYGYRTGLSLHDAVRRIVALRNRGKRIVIDADIHRCFESLDHLLLSEAIAAMLPRRDPRLDGLITIWIAMRAASPVSLRRRSRAPEPRTQTRGILQGAPISPLLCNCALHRLDRAMARRRHALVRYADDFVLLCDSLDEAEEAMEGLVTELAAMSLRLSPAKTRITDFDRGFSFLGIQFLGDETIVEVDGKHIATDSLPWRWLKHAPTGYDGC